MSDFVARHHFEDHPRWDPDLLEMSQTFQGPRTRKAGSASSLLGLARFASRGVAAALIGLGDDALPLGAVTVVSTTRAVATYVGLTRGPDHAANHRRCGGR